MNELVFLAPNTAQPFTTSQIVSEVTGIEHRKIKAAIRKHEAELKSFGLLASYQAESSGGRPQEYFKLTEQQATFLMTLLKNTNTVVAFKMELVRQFFAMRQEMNRCNAAKVERRSVRRTLTDAISSMEESPHKKWKYAQYTNLVYLAAFGRTAKAIREERGAKRTDNASDYLTSEELEQVSAFENRVSVLVEAGFDYHQIKDILIGKRRISA